MRKTKIYKSKCVYVCECEFKFKCVCKCKCKCKCRGDGGVSMHYYTIGGAIIAVGAKVALRCRRIGPCRKLPNRTGGAPPILYCCCCCCCFRTGAPVPLSPPLA